MDINRFHGWKPGSQIRADAEAAFAAMDELRNGEGGLSPQTLLDASRPEDAVLHNEFEWDDSIAAEQYRLRQAGHIIRSIVVVREKPEEDNTDKAPAICRVFFPTHDREDERRGTYESVFVLSKDEDTRARMMRDCLNELTWFRNKYAALKEIVTALEIPISILQEKINGENAG